MRSKWKGNFVGFKVAGTSRIYNKASMVTIEFLNRRVLIYNGLKFISIIIKENMIGHKFGEFVLTKKIGAQIHSNK